MSRRLTYTGFLVMMAAAACMLLSCGGTSMNESRATARVKQLAQETARAIAPGVPTTVGRGDPDVGICTGELGNKVDVGYDLLLPKLPAERTQQILLAAKGYFEKRGYTIVAFKSAGVSPLVDAETPDGFFIDYVIATDGTSYIGAGSPCV